MKFTFLLLALLAVVSPARAQTQDAKMQQWVDGNFQKAVAATNSKDPSAKSAFSDKKFDGSVFATKTFGGSSYAGTKTAALKTFETRSFLGIKNPWFGNKVFATDTSSLVDRDAREASKGYSTDSFTTGAYRGAGKKDEIDANAVLPSYVAPRTYLGPDQRDKRPGVDRYTQNLSKDLSIDDVRDLLNKGHGE